MIAARTLRHFSVETHSADFTLCVVLDVDVDVVRIFLGLIVVFGTHFNAGKLHRELNKLKCTSSLLKYLSS